jgi:hypothetical protein
MGHCPIDDVRHSFESPVRVPWSPLGFTGRIVNRSQMIQQQEWVGLPES